MLNILCQLSNLQMQNLSPYSKTHKSPLCVHEQISWSARIKQETVNKHLIVQVCASISQKIHLKNPESSLTKMNTGIFRILKDAPNQGANHGPWMTKNFDKNQKVFNPFIDLQLFSLIQIKMVEMTRLCSIYTTWTKCYFPVLFIFVQNDTSIVRLCFATFAAFFKCSEQR